MVKKEKRSKGTQFFVNVFKIVLISQWVAYTLSLFVFKDFPSWLFCPIGWVYWVLGCIAFLGWILVKTGLDNEYKG